LAVDLTELIFAAKQRSQNKRNFDGSRPADLWSFVTGSSDDSQIWQQNMRRPLAGSFDVGAAACVSVRPIGDEPSSPTTIGLRVPASYSSILSQTGPLPPLSANLSGQLPLQTMTEITAQDFQICQLTDRISSTQSRHRRSAQLLNGRVVVGKFCAKGGKVKSSEL